MIYRVIAVNIYTNRVYEFRVNSMSALKRAVRYFLSHYDLRDNSRVVYLRRGKICSATITFYDIPPVPEIDVDDLPF